MEMIFNVIQGVIVVAIEVFCCVVFFESFFYNREMKNSVFQKISIPLLIILIYIGSAFLQN